MFYIISKLLTFLVLPLGLVLILLIGIFFAKSKKRIRAYAVLAFSILYFTSSPAFVNPVLRSWECTEKNIDDLPEHKFGVLLTGGLMNAFRDYDQNLILKESGDRLWQTLHLFQKGKIEYILISGGDIAILHKNKRTEIDLAKEFLLQNGVPEDHILMENESRNTRENALFSALVLKKYQADKPFVLITSAYHMKRALACFQKVGLRSVPFGSNYLSENQNVDISDFLPSARTFSNAHLLSKEIIGFLIYKIMGYA